MYYGPHSPECLSTMWNAVRCVPEGTGYPPKLTSTAIGSFTGLGLRLVNFLYELYMVFYTSHYCYQ